MLWLVSSFVLHASKSAAAAAAEARERFTILVTWLRVVIIVDWDSNQEGNADNDEEEEDGNHDDDEDVNDNEYSEYYQENNAFQRPAFNYSSDYGEWVMSADELSAVSQFELSRVTFDDLPFFCARGRQVAGSR